MMHLFRRLSYANLETKINDPQNRAEHHSTLIDSERMRVEAPWDGMTIGDVQVYLNENVNANGATMIDGDGKPMPPKWVWFAGVPRGRVRNYRFLDASDMQPRTKDPEEVSDTVEVSALTEDSTTDENPFIVSSKKNAERQAESRSANARGGART